jgi:hypothetical protein
MRALLITPEVRAQIAAAVERARAKPLPLDFVMEAGIPGNKVEVTLADRKPGFERPSSEHVLIPHGYRAAISFEQQPAGLVRHLSVSIDQPGMMPNLQAVQALMEEFGFSAPLEQCKIWLEEFDPGHHAVNVAYLADVPATHPTKQ